MHWTANRPGSQRIICRANGRLFLTTSLCQRAADGDRPRSALRRSPFAKQVRMGEGESSPAGRLTQPLWRWPEMSQAVPSPVGRVRVRVVLLEIRRLSPTCFPTSTSPVQSGGFHGRQKRARFHPTLSGLGCRYDRPGGHCRRGACALRGAPEPFPRSDIARVCAHDRKHFRCSTRLR